MSGAYEHDRDFEDLLRTPASDAFRFNEQEREILNLWDKEQELHLEINLLKSQHEGQHTIDKISRSEKKLTLYIAQDEDLSTLSDEQIDSKIAQAEKDLLAARSRFQIRQNIIQQVLITDPILKSIHSSSATASSLEQRLLPLLLERDVVTMLHATVTSKLQSVHSRTADLEQENIEMIVQNKALAQRMLALVNDVKAEKIEEVTDARMRAQLEQLEEECVRARREWRVMKSVVAGIVAGSGVRWAEDPKLLEVVMDDEDEMD